MNNILERYAVKKCVLICLLVSLSLAPAWGLPAAYYVAANGSDSNPGSTIGQPFASISKAVASSVPGDTILVRGGNYPLSTTIALSKRGTSDKNYYLLAFPQDVSRPVLNFSAQSYSSSSRGITLSGSYWQIRGLEVFKAGDNGLYISGSNNTIECCAFYENRDSGLQLSGGASNNRIINCDSYNNYDPSSNSSSDGADADGFACKMDVGTGNYFSGCRSWCNTDDGWDGYLRGATGVTTTLENCWTWRNGFRKDGTDPGSQANGNGFKMGGSDTKDLVHNFILKNCLAFQNKAKGFDQNSNAGSITLYNCTAFDNGGRDYMLSSSPVTYDPASVFTVTNCLALGTSGTSFRSTTLLTTSNFATTMADYQSTDTTGISGPRQADGRLPDIAFMHLSPGSQCIDAGTDIGLPFKGAAPDLGCFESDYTMQVAGGLYPGMAGLQVHPNYPNPFNPVTFISYDLPQSADVLVEVYNNLGQKTTTLVDDRQTSGFHQIPFYAHHLPSGTYFYRISAGALVQTGKMLLLK